MVVGLPERLQERLEALEIGLLQQIESQTSDDDKRSILALETACRDVFGSFVYLEIGSHLGGSLQSLVTDPRCEAIFSIDPRPVIVPDNRWEEGYEYPDNSTTRMLGLLEQLDGADLGKLRTFEATTRELSPSAITSPPHLCFIDGEHTNPAAACDADFCRAVARVPGVIAFHDAPVVAPAIGRFLEESGAFGYRLRDLIFVVEFGGKQIFDHPLIRQMTFHRREWIWANRLGVASRMAGDASPLMAMRDRWQLRTRLRRLLGTLSR